MSAEVNNQNSRRARLLNLYLCSIRYMFRFLRRVYFRPAADVDRRVAICVETVTAPDTCKFSLALAVLRTTVAARAAGARRVARVNENEWHATKFGFVGQELPQLVKAPTTDPCSLRPSKPCPLADALQLFDGDAARRVLSLAHKLFTDAMVGVFLKVLLASGQSLQQAVNRTRALAGLGLAGRFVLQDLTLLKALTADSFKVRTGEGLPVRVSGDVDDAEIHAQNLRRWLNVWLINVTHSIQVKIALAVKQIHFALAEGQQFPLILAADEWNGLPALGRPDGNSLISLKGDDSVVVRDSAVLSKLALNLPVKLVSIGDFSNAAHDHLSGEVERVTNGSIDNFVQMKLLESLSSPGRRADFITGLVGQFKGLAQEARLIFGWLKFKIDNQLHAEIIAQIFKYGRFFSKVDALMKS